MTVNKIPSKMNWSLIILGKMTDGTVKVSDCLKQIVCFRGLEIGLFGWTNLMIKLEKFII